MKKIISLLLGVLLLLMSITAGAQVPDFLTQDYNNYTAHCATSIKCNGADGIEALLKETGIDEELNRNVDIISLIESLLNCESEVDMECSISEDYKKADLAVTAKAKQKITLNSNANADVAYGGGLWLHLDLTLEEPEFIFAYQTPLHNKYAVVDVMDYITKDDIDKAIEEIKSIIDFEAIEEINNSSIQALANNAKISKAGNKYTIHFDNQGFVKMMDELFAEINSKLSDMANDEVDLPSFQNLELLGKNGMDYIIELNPQGKIKNCTINADIDLNIAKIYTMFTGESWEYVSEGKIEIDITSRTDITNIGKTKPDFPVLTEENSFKSEEWDYIFHADNTPTDYVYGSMDSEIVIDGLYYFPLKKLMKGCYNKNYTFEEADGVATMTSAYFKDIEYVTVSVGSDTAYTDLGEHYIGEVVEKDGTLYVSEKFFTDVLGWDFDEYSVDVISNKIDYSFFSNVWEYYEDDEYYDDEEDDYMEYPYWWAWGCYDGLVERGGMYYVPLRQTIEDAYDDTVNIVYSNGKVTMDSPWFKTFEKIAFTVGESIAYADGKEYFVGDIIVVDGSVFVSVAFFEDIFGWKTKHYIYNRLQNTTEYEFSTNRD